MMSENTVDLDATLQRYEKVAYGFVLSQLRRSPESPEKEP